MLSKYPPKTIIEKANNYIENLVSQNKLPSGSKLGKSSRYYLVKLKYNGIKEVEMFGLTSVGKKGVRDFGWVLLEFGDTGLGGRGGIISLSDKSKELTQDPVLYSTYIPRWDVETNVQYYTPLTRYENLEVVKASKGALVLKDTFNGDTWTISKGIKDDDFTELKDFIINKISKNSLPPIDILDLHSTSTFKKDKTISLRSILESEEYKQISKPLTVPIGKNDQGDIVSVDLRDAGCILSAGQTGSGKSTFAESSLLISLLMKNSPENLRLLLIDPKMVQFSPYAGLPHLIVPPITDPGASKKAFDVLTKEIEKRLNLLNEHSVTDIDEYREKVEPIPYIFVVIDEVIDLFMVDNDYYQETFAQIAKHAKKTGVHLYMATSRPTRDAYTEELLKNFNTRIAFKVASEFDSETMLDKTGAELLAGHGDLLLKINSHSEAIRVRAPYATDDEVSKVVDFWRKKMKGLK